MTHVKRLLALALVAGIFTVEASAATSGFSIVGVGDFSNISTTNAPSSGTVGGYPYSNLTATTKSKFGLGGGVLFDAMIHPTVAIEIGALYITRKTETDASYNVTVLSVTSAASSNDTTETHYVQIPLLVRAWFNPFVSAGLGGYFAQGVGQVKTLDTSGNVTNSESWSDAQLKKSDYGLLGSLGVNIPLGTSLKFLLDGRYTYGLKDFDNSGTGEHQKYRDFQILAGLTFPLGHSR